MSEENEIILESAKNSRQQSKINNQISSLIQPNDQQQQIQINNNHNEQNGNGNGNRQNSKQFDIIQNEKYDDDVEILEDEEVEYEQNQNQNDIQLNFDTEQNQNQDINNSNAHIQKNVNQNQLYDFEQDSQDMKQNNYQNQDQVLQKQQSGNNNQLQNNNKNNSNQILQKALATTITNQIEDKSSKYNNQFFKKIEKHKTGFPTMTNKKRNIPDFLGGEHEDNQDKSFNNQSNNQDKKQGNVRMNQQLIIEMENIENHQKYRSRIEQFLMEFTKNPKDGIQYAIQNELCNDEPYDIASFLLGLDGINKYQLGQYFGSNKPRNQAIMQAYFRLMNFKGAVFDQAIRQLLARFRLPGEADQIDRVVTQFGIVYSRDNPDVFHHEDVPYILTYACIMLNVDAHNTQIEAKAKMKKENFVDINLACLSKPEYKFQDRQFLENLYDNVTKNKYETKSDDFEKGLETIMAIYSRQDDTNMQQNLDQVIKNLQKKDNNYLKYGRKGRPHARNVYLDENIENVCWSDAQNKEDKPRCMAIRDIVDIAMGSKTTEVFQKNNIPAEWDDLCFSIISKSRTLDLQIQEKQKKYEWCQFLFQTLCQKREAMTQNITKKRQKQINKIQLDEVWKNDIFTNWDFHWDYKIDKPKNFIESKNKSQFEKICPCIIKWKKQQIDKKLQHASTNHPQYDDQLMDNQRQQSQDGELLQKFQKSSKNKSFLLISLWKLGIPSWARPTIWPLTIGNRLEISDSLYDILKQQVENTIELNKVPNLTADNKQNISSVIQQIEDIKFDLNMLQPFKNQSGNDEALKISFKKQKRMILNILSAFIFYRPDVGYVKNSMVKIVYMLIQYLDEQTAFICLVNLLHSYHFLSFFKGDMKEIEWRVKFFDCQLKQKMPLVYNHFKAIDMSTEVYLMHWFLSLFANSLNDLEFLSRIWDNFLLEGEIFAFKIAMAVINFFQLELKMSPFDKALSILKNISDQVTPEYLFEIIEQIDLSWQEYQTSLQNQKISQQNAHINKVLLL